MFRLLLALSAAAVVMGSAAHAEPSALRRLWELLLQQGQEAPPPPDDVPAAELPREEPVPVNTGFKALGPAGAKGKINGPGGQGDGVYRILKNDPFEIVLELKTGYFDAVVTVSRDPKTGVDSVRFNGKRFDRAKGAWGPAADTPFEARVTYDAKEDLGHLRYRNVNEPDFKEWRKERYWGGRKGKSMTIEFESGYNHLFTQED